MGPQLPRWLRRFNNFVQDIASLNPFILGILIFILYLALQFPTQSLVLGAAALIVLGFYVGWRIVAFYQTKFVVKPALILENREVARGDAIKFKMEFSPTLEIQVAHVTALLRCFRVIYLHDRYGRDEGKSEELVAEYQGEICTNVRLAKGKTQVLDGAIRIPADVTPSERDGYYEIRWDLRAEIHIQSCPTSIIDRPITITRENAASKLTDGPGAFVLNMYHRRKPQAQPCLEIDNQMSPLPTVQKNKPKASSSFKCLELDTSSDDKGES